MIMIIIIIVIILSISILAQFIATVLREQSVYFLLGVRGGFGMDHMVFRGYGTGITHCQLQHSTMGNYRKLTAQ